LADEGVEAADAVVEIKHHLEGCADCTRFLDELRRVEEALQDLPQHDAPDALVAETLRAVRRAAEAERAPAGPGGTQRYLAVGLAASVVIAAGLGLTYNVFAPSYQKSVANREVAEAIGDRDGRKGQLAGGPVAKDAPSSSLRESELAATESPAQPESQSVATATRATGSSGAGIQEAFEIAELAQKKAETEEYRRRQETERGAGDQSFFRYAEEPLSDEEARRELDAIAQLESGTLEGQESLHAAQARLEDELKRSRSIAPEKQPAPATPGAKTKADGGYGDEADGDSFGLRSNEPLPSEESGVASKSEQQRLSGAGEVVSDLRADAPAAVEGAGNETPESEAILADDKNVRAKARDEAAGADFADADPAPVGETAQSAPSSQAATGLSGGVLRGYVSETGKLVAPADLQQAQVEASRFLNNYRSLEGLSFQDPTGYWANSYIPGDPAMRLLQARLRLWDRGALGQDVRLEQAVQPVQQPFDGPQDAAVAVYLHADTPSIEGPTRLRVQVGLKGAERQGGHRPAMNIGLLVDLRGATDAGAASRIRALTAALERARQPEDRFSLTVAGTDGGLLVPPGEFRHGPLRVAMERMFGTAQEAAPSNVDLRRAFSLASESVLAGDDPNAVLGSSLVLLVTGSSLADDVTELERMAHRNAIGGMPLSVVSLIAQDDTAHIDRLVAAGQGNRRILDSAQAADGVIDRELHTASRAVARALRLRIRLAPGVELVDVLGSRRLDESLAERVREAEQAIDQRLARNLGIQADRGEDEEGIQIVIPNFYAGDTHTILLDVVAQNPGPVADVTLRYKDVVRLGNGVARANLTVEDGRQAAGPLELNVLKNLIALEFAGQARLVGRYLAEGDPRQAAARLDSLRDLIRGLRLEVAGWQNDPDLVADEAMLDEYLAVLAGPAAGDVVQRRYLADSLRYAAFRKLQTAAR
jgi:hypothetical protein